MKNNSNSYISPAKVNKDVSSVQSESASTGRISYTQYSRENCLLFLDMG